MRVDAGKRYDGFMDGDLLRQRFRRDLDYGISREEVWDEMQRSSSYEVKSDREEWRSGKVFIEYESRGKRSGLATTEADLWVFETTPFVFTCMPTSWVKVLARDTLRRSGPDIGGDNGTSLGVLLPARFLVAPPKRLVLNEGRSLLEARDGRPLFD